MSADRSDQSHCPGGRWSGYKEDQMKMDRGRGLVSIGRCFRVLIYMYACVCVCICAHSFYVCCSFILLSVWIEVRFVLLQWNGLHTTSTLTFSILLDNVLHSPISLSFLCSRLLTRVPNLCWSVRTAVLHLILCLLGFYVSYQQDAKPYMVLLRCWLCQSQLSQRLHQAKWKS